jgi:hypothetical protein
MSRRGLALISAVAVAAVSALSPACGDDPVAQRCRDIPAGGCPGQGSTDCMDPSCVAVYTCQPDGTWLFDQPCALHDGGTDGEAPPVEASSPRDVVGIDAPPGAGGGPGCPDLQPPDCPLSLALACPAGSCCDCEDLFVCTLGEWNLWGQCVDGGITQGD